MSTPPFTPVQPSEPQLPPGGNSAGFYRAAVVAAVVLIVAVGFGFLPRLRQQAAVAAATADAAIPTVAVVSPTPGKPQGGLLLPAEVKPWVETPIYARASGYLRRYLVDIGAHVRAGQLMAEIETPELDQDIDRAGQELIQAEAQLGLAKVTAARYAEALKTASVSEQEAAEKAADLKVKVAALGAATASSRRLKELKSFARVTAPFAGTVTARTTDVGDLITAGGARELFRLAQTDTLRVTVRVPQTRALSIAVGQEAELLIPEMPNRVFQVKVARTAGAISADSRTLLVEMEADNARGEILSGSFAQVRLGEAKRAPALTLPANTLLFRAEGPQVGVVQADGTVALRAIKLGRDFGQSIEVLAGVGVNDRVIVNPFDSLVSGAKVRVAEPSAAGRKP